MSWYLTSCTYDVISATIGMSSATIQRGRAMSENLTNACNALEALSNNIRDSWSDERTLQDVYGWNHPAVTRHDIS